MASKSKEPLNHRITLYPQLMRETDCSKHSWEGVKYRILWNSQNGQSMLYYEMEGVHVHISAF